MNATEAERWLRYAEEDLLTAEAMVAREEAYPRHACWLAQQAAEKALKAALIFSHVEFPYTHDLDRLRDLLPDDWLIKSSQADLAELTQWAVDARYPSDDPDPLWPEAKAATQQARLVFDAVKMHLRTHGPNDAPSPSPSSEH